ncbi:CHASE3 domain-containing protein [Paucibacter sp. R3-3]|uniref:CHASE3 domain-containing protein n=1 Tax=Roseateles agri TaxID=3098619 RepID=A0ABU5DJW2_9BURK|nr:CHASE3 domain-containing protein [Paucibacter sp. R3-3]MDY0746591.1 CHASE3 domain-containing protein [Paucibacter sp. R3-3]
MNMPHNGRLVSAEQIPPGGRALRVSSTWSFGRKLALGFGLSFLVLMLVGGLSYRGVQSLARTSYQVAHTHEVLDRVNGLLSAMKDAETGQRGYLLSGNEAYLEPYLAARAAAPQLLAELRALVADSADQQQRVAEAGGRVDAIMKLHGERIDMRRQSGLEATLRAVQTGEGKRQMDGLRRLLGDMNNTERDLLRERAAEVESASSDVRTAIAVGTVLGLLLVVAAGAFLARLLHARIGFAVGEVQRSTNELQATSVQQAANARETSTSMTQITTTLSEMTRSSREIAASAQRVVGIAGQTAKEARAGDELLQAAHASIATMREQAKIVGDRMQELGGRSRQVDLILDLVSELADQTNILAINASIEAVSAGEAGARFGTVADEIRRLADRMTISAKEIRTQIADVRATVEDTKRSTQAGADAVEAGVSRFTAVAASFADIGAMVVKTNDAAHEIELATQQQATAVEQLGGALAHTAQAAQETEVSSAQTSQTALRLAEMSRGLMQLIRPRAAQ